VPRDIEGAEEAIQQLVDLGYIEPLSEDKQERIQNTRLDLKTNLIRALMDSTRFMDAIPLLEELIEQKPDNDWFKLTLAECYQRSHQTEKAKVLVNELSEEAKKDSTVLSLMANIAFSQKQPDRAFQYLLDALKVNPHSVSIGCDLGRAHLQLGQIDEAEKAFLDCLKLDPSYAFAHNGLTSVYIVREDFDKAAEHALEAIDLIPHFPEAHFNLGLALIKLGKRPEAITAFESCENMRYNLLTIYKLLAKLHGKDDPNKAQHYKELFRQTKAKGDLFIADE
jgi:tetratricopeptide (TPR) repeat protein